MNVDARDKGEYRDVAKGKKRRTGERRQRRGEGGERRNIGVGQMKAREESAPRLTCMHAGERWGWRGGGWTRTGARGEGKSKGGKARRRRRKRVRAGKGKRCTGCGAEGEGETAVRGGLRLSLRREVSVPQPLPQNAPGDADTRRFRTSLIAPRPPAPLAISIRGRTSRALGIAVTRDLRPSADIYVTSLGRGRSFASMTFPGRRVPLRARFTLAFTICVFTHVGLFHFRVDLHFVPLL